MGFSNQDSNGPFWIEKSKDNHILSSATDYFEANVDEYIESQDFYGEIDQVGTRQGDVYTTDTGIQFRIGPYPTGTAAVSSGASGTDILPNGWASNHRANEISFLTTGTHAGDDASTWPHILLS